jgi:exodeoxyribonuclease VII small subunit
MKKKTFEEQLSRLEEIVDILDKAEEPLENLVKIYEEGISLTNQLRETLNETELKIEKISKQNFSRIEND